jgi:hypothetical protein
MKKSTLIFNNLSVLIALNSVYAILLILGSLINAPALSSYLSLFPIFLVLFFFLVKFAKQLDLRFSKLDLLLVFLLSLGALFQFFFAPYPKLSDYIKFILIFVLYFMGKNEGGIVDRGAKNIGVFLLILLPIICLFIYLLNGESIRRILFFSNRNNVVAYCFVCFFILFYLGKLGKYPHVIVIFFVSLFNTLGALLSYTISIFLSYSRFNFKMLLFITSVIIFSILLFNYSELAIVERIKIAITGISQLFSHYSLSDMANVSYGDYVKLQGGSSDVSLFFRIKHWSEIVSIMLNGDLASFGIGSGMNASMALTSIGLVPHNDWLRILFELGLLNFLAFLILNLFIAFKIYYIDRFLFVVFITFNMYMFSENIINNFIITSMMYYTAGLISRSTPSL